MTRLALEPIYGSVWVALAIAFATVALIVWVTPPTANPAHRRWLIALRSAAAVMMLLTVFRPTVLRTDNRPAEATLVVAADTSRSMTLPDGDGGDRWSRQVECWRRLAEGTAGLESLSVRLIAYDKDARTIASDQPDALDAQSPSGDLTDLAAAATAAIRAAQGNPIVGVVLMGDGTQTAPVQPAGAQRVVETLDSIGVPLWSVPIGPAGGERSSRDVAIEALPQSYQLFAGNEVSIDFQAVSRGLAGVEVPIRLRLIEQSGDGEEIASRVMLPERSNDSIAFSIPITAPSPGTYRLEVEADSPSGELFTVNNRQVAFVDVREGGGRILYIEGTLREEQLRIRQALSGFPDLDLQYRWIPPDTAPDWPMDMNVQFQPGRYDIYIVGDLDSAAIGREQLTELASAVRDGAGLLTLGGLQTYGIGGYADSPLADAIPVRMDGSLRRSVDQPREERHGQLEPPVPIRLSRLHPVTNLGGDDPSETWQQLPPQLGANRLLGPKPIPGVQVLLETPDENPLLVVGEYGEGRTAALAIDSTYRWWRAGNKREHKQFWRQLMLWLLNREDTAADQIRIELDSQRFDVGQPPEFRASVQSLGEQEQDFDLVAEVVNDSGEATEIPVSSDAEGETAIRGQIPELETGFYRLRVRPAEETASLQSEEVPFQVTDQSREMQRPMADPVYLRQLAQLTAEHGGAAFAPDEIDQLIEMIAQRRRQAETPVVDKYRLGDGPLSGWLVFTLFAAALATEWLLRRRWGIA